MFRFTDGDLRAEAPWIKHSRRYGGGPGMTGPGTAGYPGGGAPAQPSAPSAFDQSLVPFNQALPGQQANILANQQQLGQMANKAGDASRGIDPRFAQYGRALTNQLETQRTGATNQLNQQLANSGMGNSTAGINEQNRLNLGYNQQEQALAGQLGMQGLGQANQAFQAQAGLLGQNTQMGNEYLQNYLANPAMQIANTAAQNAGNQPSGKGAGGGKL